MNLVHRSSKDHQDSNRTTGFGPMICAQKVTKKFGEFFAVREISFQVARGEIFAFLGPGGSSETTTIKMPTAIREKGGENEH